LGTGALGTGRPLTPYVLKSTADLIDFPQAAGLEAMASEAVH
jgi:hypothetical protein